LLKNTKIKGVHHLHIWALSSQSNALTAHISLEKPSFGDWEGIKKELKHDLFHEGIQHVTLELEMVDADCKELAC
jgi:cobalt-zinc-cadmium efflux system protein